ncbi:MAG: transcriptional repressor [Pseudomonadota bacterium]
MSRAVPASAQLPDKWRKLAEDRCAEMGARLTPARLAAYAELVACDRALSAYELVSLLEQRQERKIAPLTAYRHLEFLINVGLVHRLESAQSYLPCAHPGHDHVSQYLLCTDCGMVNETDSEKFETLLNEITEEQGFVPHNSVIEVAGLCRNCASKPES